MNSDMIIIKLHDATKEQYVVDAICIYLWAINFSCIAMQTKCFNLQLIIVAYMTLMTTKWLLERVFAWNQSKMYFILFMIFSSEFILRIFSTPIMFWFYNMLHLYTIFFCFEMQIQIFFITHFWLGGKKMEKEKLQTS